MSEQVTYTITGRSAKGGAFKTMLLIQVAIKVDDQIPFKSQKSDLEVIVEGPEEPKISVLGGERGNFHVGFNPNIAGQYWLDFVYKGIVANEPFLVPVKDMFNKVPEVHYTGKSRNGALPPVSALASSKADAPASSKANAPTSSKVDAPKADAAVSSKADSKRDEEQRHLKEEKLRLEAEEKERSRLEGHVVAVTFIFRALNRYGKPKSTGGDTDAFSVTANGEKITLIEDAGDGTYTVDYNSVPGENEVDVQYKGNSIKGFPVKFFRKVDGE